MRSTAQWAENRALAAQRPDLVASFARITDEQPATALPITPLDLSFKSIRMAPFTTRAFTPTTL